MSEPRSILLVAYFYPPSLDAGARRPATMAKYLRRLGHSVTVLTTSAHGSGSPDEAEVSRSADLQLLRARLRGRERIEALYDGDTYSPRPHPLSRVIVPEPLAVAWAPFAKRRALRLHAERRFDCVITTSPPESAHAIGRALQRRGVAWVADLRDAWTFEPIRPRFPTALQRRLDERLERRRLEAADAVVCVSRPAADDLRERLGIEPLLVPNGWDPEVDVAVGEEDAGGLLDTNRISLVYTGRFGSHGRDPGPLIRSLGIVAREDPEMARRLELLIAGPLTPGEVELMRTDVSPARIAVIGTLPRERALSLQRAADALLLVASPSRTQLINYKLFEYLAAARPILALAAGTEAGRIVAEVGAGEAMPADDEGAIAAGLRRLAAGELPPPAADAVSDYSYPGLAERMADAVEGAIARGSR